MTHRPGVYPWRPAPHPATTPWAMELLWERVVHALALSPAARVRVPGSRRISSAEAGAFPRTDHRLP